MDELIAKLHAVKAVKFGSFTLKSGIISPIYFDLRVIISYPDLMELVATLLWKQFEAAKTDLVCGVPYTALPMATIISVRNNVPMLLRRKEAKDYGTKKLIEGEFKSGQSCLIVEDVVTSGTSVLETAKELRKEGLVITDAVVLLDRQQGGKEQLSEHGIKLHSVLDIETFMGSLEKQGLIGLQVVSDVMQFIRGNVQTVVRRNPRLKSTLGERMESCKHPLALRLLKLMESKQSNLCVAADLTKLEDVINLAETIGPKIVVLKIHVDIFEDFELARIQQLKLVSEKHNFLIMEDRKFGDIANTSQLQFSCGIYHIRQWADLITVHPLPGPQLISNILNSPHDLSAAAANCGVVLVLEMSSQNALTTPEYRAEGAKWAGTASDIVMGFVGQSPLDQDDPPGWIQFSPGVSSTSKGDAKGQQYTSPADAVLLRGADVLIIGRGLTQFAASPDELVVAAEQYRLAGWEALCQRSKPSQ